MNHPISQSKFHRNTLTVTCTRSSGTQTVLIYADPLVFVCLLSSHDIRQGWRIADGSAGSGPTTPVTMSPSCRHKTNSSAHNEMMVHGVHTSPVLLYIIQHNNEVIDIHVKYKNNKQYVGLHKQLAIRLAVDTQCNVNAAKITGATLQIQLDNKL